MYVYFFGRKFDMGGGISECFSAVLVATSILGLSESESDQSDETGLYGGG